MESLVLARNTPASASSWDESVFGFPGAVGSCRRERSLLPPPAPIAAEEFRVPGISRSLLRGNEVFSAPTTLQSFSPCLLQSPGPGLASRPAADSGQTNPPSSAAGDAAPSPAPHEWSMGHRHPQGAHISMGTIAAWLLLLQPAQGMHQSLVLPHTSITSTQTRFLCSSSSPSPSPPCLRHREPTCCIERAWWVPAAQQQWAHHPLL